MKRVPEIFLVCPGLGHIFRGYETFTRQCFDVLREERSFRMRLFKGAGPESDNETRIPILRRTSLMAPAAARLIGRTNYDAEQLTFALGLIPYLVRERPEVVFFSDQQMGGVLWRWRRLSQQKFRLLFSNGGPAQPPFPRWDHIHQVSPEHYEEGLRRGVSAEKQTLIPYGYSISRQPQVLSSQERIARRRRLELPTDGPIVISVGMLSATHKRMDYLIKEVCSLPEPRPYLVMLGQSAGSETENIRAMAERMLGPGRYRMASVPPDQVQEYYRNADVFVLASLAEGLPRVLLEALAEGLPCIAHDYATTRYVLGSSGYLADLRSPGALAKTIVAALQEGDLSVRVARQRDAYERFSWDRLAPQYASMVRQVAVRSSENQGPRTIEPTLGATGIDDR